MKRIIFITIFAVILFFAEFFLKDILDIPFIPNLLIILVVYSVLSFGIYYGFFSAVVSGVLLDSFGTYPLGINTISLITSAFILFQISKYIDASKSSGAKLLIVFFVFLIDFIINYSFRSFILQADIFYYLKYIFIPRGLATIIIALPLLKEIRKCASKFYVF